MIVGENCMGYESVNPFTEQIVAEHPLLDDDALIFRVPDDAAAIRIANDTPFGLVRLL